MKKILFTGGSGFIGSNIVPVLKNWYDVAAPNRHELNIKDKNAVDDYLRNNSFDALVHSAVHNPVKNPAADKGEDEIDSIIRSFLHFESNSNKFQKIIYFGTGAEYNKEYDIKYVKEESIGMTIPRTPHFFAKYVLNKIARNSKNIYNLRLFGIYGPRDVKSKFIRDCIDACLENRAVTIRQDCRFDYMYVEDLAYIVKWFIENEPRHHDYNVVSGKPIFLSEIAKITADKMNNKKPLEITKEGLNNEYTADNSRLLSEMKEFNFTSIEDGIEKQIYWQRSIYEKN